MATPAPDVDALVAQLRATVEERRREGAYPPGLEHELDDQARLLLYRRVHSARPVDVSGPLARIRAALPISAPRIPRGRPLERLAAGLVRRQSQGILDQIQGFAVPASESLAALATAVEDLTAEVGRLRPPLQAMIRRQAMEESRAAQASARKAAGTAGSG
ncbi:MAG: hypothetical protein ACRD0C_17975 [Acidimicrobiia bacterium]